MKKFAIKIISKEENEVINKWMAEIIWKGKICYVGKEDFEDKYAKDKRYHKVRDYCPNECRGIAHSICNLKYSIPKEITIIFHNGSKYDYDFTTKELAEEFEQNTCLGENTEKYITFSVLIEQESLKN